GHSGANPASVDSRTVRDGRLPGAGTRTEAERPAPNGRSTHELDSSKGNGTQEEGGRGRAPARGEPRGDRAPRLRDPRVRRRRRRARELAPGRAGGLGSVRRTCMSSQLTTEVRRLHTREYEQHKMLSMIERMHREGRSEQEIVAALRDAG